MRWQILNSNRQNILMRLLENRNLKTKKEIDNFLNPKDPYRLKLKALGIKGVAVKKILERIKLAKKNREKIVIFGDYDCDGVCATAILWEAMYRQGYDVMPYIPNRFEEGYGLKPESFRNAKLQMLNAKLIITLDNGIVAYEGINEAKKLGIDVIVVDHHTKGTKKHSTSYVLHSTVVCGSALAWFLARELTTNHSSLTTGLDLVTLGTIADQMPLLGINRSLVKYGLQEFLKTKRVGLQAMINDLKVTSITTYEVGYLIVPRINAMGRLASATDALRFLCTRDPKKARDLNKLLNETNIERQGIVDNVITQVLKQVEENDKIIVISGNYHEGVIGLASGKITEKFYRPSIILSESKSVSKASARSINGFNIIEAIKETGLIIEGGGHPMAAGFSIETKKVEEFKIKINKLAEKTLTDEILEKKLKIDLELEFSQINSKLVEVLKKFEPIGFGNFQPIFMTKKVKVKEVKAVGSDGKHLKMKLEKDGVVLDAIYFGGSANSQQLTASSVITCAYSIEENVWNNHTSLQLKIKDIK